MIISVEYENGVLKVTPPLDPTSGKRLAEAVFEVAAALDDGHKYMPGEIGERLRGSLYEDDD